MSCFTIFAIAVGVASAATIPFSIVADYVAPETPSIAASQILAFTFDNATNLVTQHSETLTSSAQTYVAHPTGSHVYGFGVADGTLHVYSVDAATAAWSPVGSPVLLGATTAGYGISSCGRYLAFSTWPSTPAVNIVALDPTSHLPEKVKSLPVQERCDFKSAPIFAGDTSALYCLVATPYPNVVSQFRIKPSGLIAKGKVPFPKAFAQASTYLTIDAFVGIPGTGRVYGRNNMHLLWDSTRPSTTVHESAVFNRTDQIQQVFLAPNGAALIGAGYDAYFESVPFDKKGDLFMRARRVAQAPVVYSNLLPTSVGYYLDVSVDRDRAAVTVTRMTFRGCRSSPRAPVEQLF
uniref:Secreted protein n=1 Tax=Achlya hypogyna TaxID=1202772 RepID=A0A0A7CNN1_ACHHY|nr:secreted protein [Achlya hypogyna]